MNALLTAALGTSLKISHTISLLIFFQIGMVEPFDL